jgi:hypothetical protein
MITLEEAKQAALAWLPGYVDPSIEIAFIDAEAIAKPYGWILFWGSRRFMETGNIEDAVGGGGPVVVLHDGSVEMLSEAAPTEERIANFERRRGLRG